MLLYELRILRLQLLEVRLRDPERVVNARNFRMLFVKYADEVVLHFLLGLFELFLHLRAQVRLLLFEFFDSLVQYFDVQLQLLFNLDMVTHLRLILLQLLLVLFWG